MNNRLEKWKIAGWVFLFCVAFSSTNQAQQTDKIQLQFEEAVELIETHFYDSTAVSNALWENNLNRAQNKVDSISKITQLADVINALLATLNTSHSYYFSKNNPKRYQLLGVFNRLYEQDREDLFVYEGIGIDTRLVEGQFVICSIFDGFPAHQAGLQYGDRILSVDEMDFQPIESFKGKAGQTVLIKVDRRGVEKKIYVEVAKLDGRTMFQEAAEASVRIIDQGGKKVGYIHLWSYAGPQYQELLRSKILWGELSTADALVLDLRDGWGGADLNYLSLFREPIATVSSRSREGLTGSYSGVWEKPVALLVNERSTSGKELFTFGFKKLQLGPIIGTTTAGAVVSGRIFLLFNGDVLYLAVNDVEVDGERLEGKGVAPDIKVERSLLNPPAGDPQLQKAVEQAAKLIK